MATSHVFGNNAQDTQPEQPPVDQLCDVRVILYSEWPDQTYEAELKCLYRGLSPIFSVFGIRQGARYSSPAWIQTRQISRSRVNVLVQFTPKDVGAQMFLTISQPNHGQQIVKLTRGLVQVSLGMVYDLQREILARISAHPGPYNPRLSETSVVAQAGNRLQTPTRMQRQQVHSPKQETLQYSIIEKAPNYFEEGRRSATPVLIAAQVERSQRLLQKQDDLQRRLDDILQEAQAGATM